MITHRSSPFIPATYRLVAKRTILLVKVVNMTLDKYDQESNKHKTCLVQLI